jgi:hypothetical protein
MQSILAILKINTIIAMNVEQIKEEIRKLNGLEKSAIYRWIDEEAASDLLCRIGAPGNQTEAEWHPKGRGHLSPSSRILDRNLPYTRGGHEVPCLERKAEDKVKVDDRVKGGISSVVKYRLIVGGIGIAYEGESESEARRWFRRFVVQSQTEGSSSARESVTLFRNYDLIRDYHAPDRE